MLLIKGGIIMKKAIAYVSAMAIITTTILSQISCSYTSHIGKTTVLNVFSPKVVQAAQNVSIVLNGNHLAFSGTQPQLVNGSVLVPARGVFENMGFQAQWDDSTKTSTLRKEGMTIVSQLGASYFTVNGSQKSLDVPVQIIDGTLMLPLRAISEATGAQVNWDANAFTASINTDAQASAQPATPVQPSPGRPEVEDIIFDGYVINKVNVGNGVTLCKGDTKEIVESLLGKPDRDVLNNQYGIDNGPENHNLWYDDLNLCILYTNDGLLKDIGLQNPEHSFMGYKVGDPFSLDQQLRSYEEWNPGFGYAWPDIMAYYREMYKRDSLPDTYLTSINYTIGGNTTYTNEPKPTSVGAIFIRFYYH